MRLYLIAAITVFLCGIVVMFPARVAVDWFAPDNIRINGISGTIWNGKANALQAPGLYLSRLEWSTRPFSLLTGGLGLNVKASPAGGFIETALTLRSSNRVSIRDLTAALPLSVFAQLARTSGLTGNASLRFPSMEIANGIATSADGVVELANVSIPAVYPGTLGGYRLEFSDLDDGIIASIEDTDGVLDVAGTLTLGGDRSYSLLAQVAAKRETPAELKKRVDLLPTGNSPGQREIRLEGSL